MISPHHGSMTSSTKSFVDYTNPTVIVHSAGFANQWNFPRPEVIERYRTVGSESYTTYQEGALSVTLSDDGELEVATERSTRSHFWY